MVALDESSASTVSVWFVAIDALKQDDGIWGISPGEERQGCVPLLM